jgi:tetratricopeptide (TPR) repeat protein/predicted aspartyl protease
MGRGYLAIALAFGLLAAGPADAACQIQKYVELPVTIENGAALVAAKLNGQDARLTVDTGAFFSMLSPAAVAKFGLKTGPLPPTISVGGLTGEATVKVTTVKDFSVLGTPLHSVDFLVGEHGMGDSDGLIGQNLLSLIDIEFDFSGGAIRLMKPIDCGDAPLAYWASDPRAYGAISIDPIVPPQQRIVGSVTINGVRMRALFDTGARRSVLSVQGAHKAGVKTTDPGVVSGGVWGGVGRGLTQTWIAPFNTVDIGGEQVKNTRLRIADITLTDADMIIGADFFLSHRIYVSKGQRKVYFTYNGGPVFNLEVPPGTAAPPPTQTAAPATTAAGATPPAADEPTDAAGFTRRGNAYVARDEFALAVADFGRAAELEPAVPQHEYDRARARLQNRQPILALGDLDQALKLKPDYVAALVLRGEVRAAIKYLDGAKTDFDAALALDPNVRLQVANAYARANQFDAALADYDIWIASHPKNEDLVGPLNGRCWVRALSGRDLDKALDDCNEALKLWPGAPQVLDSRGLVFLRLNQPDKAIADYDAALKVMSHNAWSLYGRGLAKQLKGQKSAGDADIAAAVAIAPQIAKEAKRVGLGPSA